MLPVNRNLAYAVRPEWVSSAVSASRYPAFRPDERPTGLHIYSSEPCAKRALMPLTV